uniref:Putative secreted protein n=1 Tax=Anopheles darlingi TaxID=43151 RepID=A0A2M4DH95_ANODA
MLLPLAILLTGPWWLLMKIGAANNNKKNKNNTSWPFYSPFQQQRHTILASGALTQTLLPSYKQPLCKNNQKAGSKTTPPPTATGENALA